MKNTFGTSIAVTLFGESHGEYIGAVLDGLAPGIKIDKPYIEHMLKLRRPAGKISTPRKEADNIKIISGVVNGRTTGTPLTILIPNENVKSGDYSKMKTVARPSHADYTAQCKYHGFQDSRGGGHFSGRITAALVAAGAICKFALEQKGIFIGTHVKKCAGISDRNFEDIILDIKYVNEKTFAVFGEETEEKMVQAILEAANTGDSVGGILETAIVGMPKGVGEPWFDSIESLISHMMFSIPAVKGIEFGAGFSIADMEGSTANDPWKIEDGEIKAEKNNNGGINGGITNGMPIVFRTAIKPTPTIFKPQNTVDFLNMKETVLEPKGRHDPAIVHRARVVQDAAAAIVICDVLAMRYGTDWLGDAVEVSAHTCGNILGLKENIVLTGMPGSGKSTVGRLLEVEGFEFIDTDEIIEKKCGCTIRELIHLKGEEYFRDLESEVIKEVSSMSSRIISTGGGAVLREENVQHLKQNGKVFYINADMGRLSASESRPLSDTPEKLKRIYEERKAIYESTADIIVPDMKTPEEEAEYILKKRMELMS